MSFKAPFHNNSAVCHLTKIDQLITEGILKALGPKRNIVRQKSLINSDQTQSLFSRDHTETFGLGIKVMQLKGAEGSGSKSTNVTPRINLNPQLKTKKETMAEIMKQIGRTTSTQARVKLPSIANKNQMEKPPQQKPSRPVIMHVKEKNVKRVSKPIAKLPTRSKSEFIKKEPVVVAAQETEDGHNDSSGSIKIVLSIKQSGLNDLGLKTANQNWESAQSSRFKLTVQTPKLDD